MRNALQRSGRVARIALLVLAGASPFLIHAAVATGGNGRLVGTLVAMQALLVAAIAPRGGRPVLRAASIGIGAVLLVLAWSGAGDSLLGFSGLPHALAYLGLLAYFGWSLQEGREDVVGAVARRVRGELPPAIAAYARRATKAWCVFFLGQVLVSGFLFAFASPSVWSLFVNVLNLPLVALMFAAEYAYRLTLFSDETHTPFAVAFRAFARPEEGQGGSAPP